MSKKPLKLYTKTGDKGQSNVIPGIRLPKDDIIFEVLGSIDELNAHLGLAISQIRARPISGLDVKTSEATILQLVTIQDTLINLGALIAGSEKIDLSVTSTQKMEELIDFYQENTRKDWFTTFLLPGGIESAAQIDVARTVCRRAERCLAHMSHQPDVDLYIKRQTLGAIQSYVNRLSDYLFALRCFLNSKAGFEEQSYKPQYSKLLNK